ncbi:MAG: hypothetical protein C0402_08450 [Thermodesulfovibrio sp.]|nr:hypothetical protein [Thermodesulfovibrio sp.]
MNRIFQILQLGGLNSILLIGVVRAGWSDGTALALFWCENMLMLPLISLRIYLHRKATNKRGHYVEEQVKHGGGLVTRRTITFNNNYLTIIGAFTVAEGVFVALIIFMINKASIDLESVRQGVTAAAAFMLVGFGLDLIGLNKRPFAWIRSLSDVSLRRVVLLFFTIMLGMPLIAWLDRPKLIFGIFGSLKLFFDMAGLFQDFDPEEAPGWMVTVLGKGFSQYWRQERAQEHHIQQLRAVTDEEPYEGKPGF